LTADLFAVFGAYQGVILALALGLLIGVERGWSRRGDPDGARVAGIRTYGLLGLAGGVAGEMVRTAPALAAVLLGGSAAVVVAGYIRSSQSGRDISATAAIVAMVTLGAGLAAATGHGVLACIVAAMTTLILSSRRRLHAWLATLSETEIEALARFALISLAVLPLLPDRPMGPLLAWNPRSIWLVVVFVSGFSFAGYVATRRLGLSRGLVVASAAGAIVSSTAVTAALAGRLHRKEAPAAVLTSAIAAASAVMFMRVLILTAVLAPFAFPSLAVLTAPSAILAVGWAARLVWPDAAPEAASPGAPIRNPFDLAPALGLAALVAGLSLAARFLHQTLGQAGVGTVLAISGMVDVDSAIIAASGLPPGTLDGRWAGLILSAPVMLNTLVKAAITVAIAGWRSGGRAALPLALCIGTYLAAVLAAFAFGWL